MTEKVEVNTSDVPEVRTPINYNELCLMVGELYVESYIRVTSAKRQAKGAAETHMDIIKSLQAENEDLKRQIKELESLATSTKAGDGDDS